MRAHIDDIAMLASTRAGGLRVRLAIAGCGAVAVALLSSVQLAIVLSAIVVASQVLDREIFARLAHNIRRNQPEHLRLSLATFSIVQATICYDVFAIAMWFAPSDAGKIYAATWLLGALLHVAVHMHHSQRLLVAGLIVHAVVLIGLPAMSLFMEPDFGVAAAATSLFGMSLYIAHIIGVSKSYRSKSEELRVALKSAIEAQEEAQAASERAIAANEAKSVFIANVSHEIRTPLNGVLGIAKSLSAEGLPTEQAEKVQVILESGSSLRSLLDDILDLSKIEADKLGIEPVAADLRQVVGSVVSLFESRARDKGLMLTCAYWPNTPSTAQFDATRVRQCVANLVSNAIKYTDTGAVDVLVSAKPIDSAGGHEFSVAVSDTGIGLSADDAAQLFNQFSQVASESDRRMGGTGLGLAISRKLARLMNGDVTVSSTPGHGSTFTLTFRAIATEAAEVNAPPVEIDASQSEAIVAHRRVLLVDDNQVNRQVARLFLEPYTTAITDAVNGQEALELLSQKSFDIVLLDIHMPVMDGAATIKQIRASDEDWSDIPVIALTADAMAGDCERYLAMGMDGYAPKPIDQRQLVGEMARLLADASATGSPAGTGDMSATAGAQTAPDEKGESDSSMIASNFQRLDVAERDEVNLAGIAEEWRRALIAQLRLLCEALKDGGAESYRPAVDRILHDCHAQAPLFGFLSVGHIAEMISKRLAAADSTSGGIDCEELVENLQRLLGAIEDHGPGEELGALDDVLFDDGEPDSQTG